ncbi:FmdE family protein [Streptomyces sp. NPDC052301]|uniref:FmdE family protein n=1 Tax=Streptomyces sp. NPDC052301 TaxID=3365687 RepID=UPI0037D164AB
MDRDQAYKDVVAFHRHECPGAAFGVRVAEAALSRLDTSQDGLVVVSEIDTCAVDALQVLTGCTYGKRNLLHQDNGRNVFTFWEHGNGKGLRIRAKADSIVYRTKELWELSDRIENGTASPQDESRFAELQAERTVQLLQVDEEEILTVDEVEGAAPQPKRLAPVDTCEECGEPTSVETLHDHRGRMLCPACHLDAHGGTLPANHGDHGHHPHSHAHRH